MLLEVQIIKKTITLQKCLYLLKLIIRQCAERKNEIKSRNNNKNNRQKASKHKY